MAVRPVFVPTTTGTFLVNVVDVSFTWHSGMAASQKKKNIIELHARATEMGLERILEVSTKSEYKHGQRLSAFYLPIEIGNRTSTVEAAYQSSKVFEQGGPFQDLMFVDSREAKRDPRIRESGKLVAFEFEGRRYPLTPATAFYDWLYIRALAPHRSWVKKLHAWDGFTDIEFNPDKSLNCQARSLATLLALDSRVMVDVALESFEGFAKILSASSI